MRRHSVDNALKTRRRRNTAYGSKPTVMDQDFAARALQAKVYLAIYNEGAKRMPPGSRAGRPATVGQPAASSGAAERHVIYASSSASPISP
eukprot:4807357-Pyramimonas_sp.AAC.1